VGSVVDRGHELGMTVVADGVEDATARALSDLQPDVGQGYLCCTTALHRASNSSTVEFLSR
jgi:EAL domain-containing protein (putative c-di-GMP-specific phosphodiesterase class I)